MLIDLKLKEFVNQVSGNDPVPGGGSISAVCGALASALAEMVTGLTIGRAKYAEVEDDMKDLAAEMAIAQAKFLKYIDEDAEACNQVFQAYKLPKETAEENVARNQSIQQATLQAALVPLDVARAAVDIMPAISRIAANGNRNAITDACVAMMCARTACFGALLNVRINLSSLKDNQKVSEISLECDELYDEAEMRESVLLQSVNI